MGQVLGSRLSVVTFEVMRSHSWEVSIDRRSSEVWLVGGAGIYGGII